MRYFRLSPEQAQELSEPAHQRVGKHWKKSPKEAARRYRFGAMIMEELRSYVYVMRAEVTGDIKIGMTCNVKARLRELQAANSQDLKLLLVLDGGAENEEAIYTRFRAHLIRSEWFRPHPDLLTWIEKVAAKVGWAQ